MPLFDIENPDTGEIITVEHPQSPTQEEAIATLQGLKPSPAPALASNALAQQDAEIKQYIAQNTPGSRSSEALSSLVAPVQAGAGLAGSIANLLLRGVQGVGTMFGTASAQEGLANKALNLQGATNQTALEVVPRAAYELGQGAVGAFGNLPAATNTLRSLNAVVNPIGAAIQALISPRAAPTEQEALQALELQNLTTSLAQQGEQPIAAFAQQQAGLPVLGETNIDVARAVPLLAGSESLPLSQAISRTARAVESTAGVIPRAISRVKPTATQSAVSTLKITPEEAEAMLPSAVPNIIKAAGKSTPTAEETLVATPKARKALFDEATSGLTKAKEKGLVAKGNSVFDDVVEAIESDTRFVADNPQEVARLTSKYEKYNRDLDPLEARKFLEDTNKNLVQHWDKTAKGQKLDLTDAEVRAERAFAANLSNQIDELYNIGSGKLASPYKDIGKIIEFEKNLKLEKAGGEQAFAERVAPTRQKGSRNLPLPMGAAGKVQSAAQTSRGITSAFRSTEPELLNKRLSEIFRGTGKQPKIIDLPEETINSLSNQYRRRVNPPTLPISEAPTASAASTLPSDIEIAISKAASKEELTTVEKNLLEKEIKSIIRGYPSDFRRDAGLARVAAQRELGIIP